MKMTCKGIGNEKDKNGKKKGGKKWIANKENENEYQMKGTEQIIEKEKVWRRGWERTEVQVGKHDNFTKLEIRREKKCRREVNEICEQKERKALSSKYMKLSGKEINDRRQKEKSEWL